MQGYTDTPVEGFEHDLMDVKVYVESLSEFILDCDTPMTIAIQGDWGSGKTSMLNMIKQQIADKIIPIWFNTWQYSQFEMASYLSISLLSNFLDKIGAEKESKNFLKNIAKGAMTFTKTATVVVTEQILGETVAGNLNEKFSETGTQDASKALEELRDKIQEAVNAKLKSSKKNRIVVFVDDLDRLAPEKAVELLEVLKVFMDVPKCVFVLAVDYAVVTQGLEKKYGVGIGHSKGRSFFDKIIQLPFAIPIGQYNITAYIKNLLSNMSVVCTEDDIDVYREIVDSSIGCNPRSMKRLFNSFILLNTVASKKGMFNGADGIQEKDKQLILFATLCLQMAFQEIYEAMIKNINELNGALLEGFKDFELLKTDDTFEKIRMVIPIKEDSYYRKVNEFMELFYNCLQLDDDKGNLSDEEVDNLKNILSFSSITSNTREEIQPKQGRQANNYEFWKYFLEKIQGRSVLFKKTNPTMAGSVVSSSGIIGGISYSIYVTKNKVGYSLNLYRGKEHNKTIFDELEKYKDDIEKNIGKPLHWMRMDDKKASVICHEKTGMNVYLPGEWSGITEYLIDGINKMEQVFKPYLVSIAPVIKAKGGW